ncbi:hypothetical protein AQJ84_39450 [Streptomyces resistomycificus]|uniref:Tryptophan halogenase n=2 Tax=Streptomyces resistomycificus TaxID=67356 RepID=A0A0L8L3I4_9ACTN|nr:hypothetical protein ADK37_26355 [Streptomyces resistomycificus]KUN90583.1 hypothetical protein AQJ84_39450 [Streptomyces resistomycificus]
MTASYLKAALGDDVALTLVAPGETAAPPDETSLGDLAQFFDVLQRAEEDWMPACDATYKLAVRFQDFSRPRHHFYLPFEQMPQADGFPLTEWWLRMQPSGRFDRDCFVAAWLCDAQRSPRHTPGPTPGQDAARPPYGYHLDAQALTRYLTAYAVERGVHHLTDEVHDVRLDARGWIDHVMTARHGAVDGDLFIDCTGTRGLLLRRALKVPFVSYQDTLPGDSMVTLRVDADMKAHGIPPYTAITAQAAGWTYSIPLLTRIATGYVYAQEYCTPQEAERTLREAAGPEAAGAPATHTTLSFGRSLHAWKHNCVAVGAAAGRVQPLQATAISYVHHALQQLAPLVAPVAQAVRSGGPHTDLQEHYNTALAQELDAARDLSTLHYLGAARQDTQFWRDAQTCPLPDALAQAIERWRVRPPGTEHQPGPKGLPQHAHTSILLGTGALALPPSTALSPLDDRAARQEFAALKQRAQTLVKTLPTQYDYFSQISA